MELLLGKTEFAAERVNLLVMVRHIDPTVNPSVLYNVLAESGGRDFRNKAGIPQLLLKGCELFGLCSATKARTRGVLPRR